MIQFTKNAADKVAELIEEELDMMQPTEQDAIVAKNLIDRIKNGVKNS